MTVKELIKQLQRLEPDLKVYLCATDSEGNGIYALDELTNGNRVILWAGTEVLV